MSQPDPLPLPAGDWHVVPARSELGFLPRMLGLIPVRGRYSGSPVSVATLGPDGSDEIQSPGKQGIWPGALRPERQR